MAPIGLILTSAPDLAHVRDALAASRAAILKVVPAWGLPHAWQPAEIAAAAHLAETLIVRTSWGDPSYAGGSRTLPKAAMIRDELAPWLRARPDAWIEVGNEPLLADAPDEAPAWEYVWYLGETIDALRRAYPAARIIAPAHTLDHPIRLGGFADGVGRWLAIAAQASRRCDALGLHAYSAAQAVDGLGQLRRLVGAAMPIWLTEFALDEALSPGGRAARYRELLATLPVAAACLYHLNLSGGAATDPNPNYDLDDATLAALGAPAPPPADAASVHFPDAHVDGFSMDVWQWRTVAAFRQHLAGYAYAATAPWAQGIVVHHSVSPTAVTWRGLASILAMARFYRYEVENGPGQPKGGWPSGPHLFIASGCLDARQDGIWQMTPLSVPGTHARAANPHYWGIEHVGDYTRLAWPPDVAACSAGVQAALLDWAGLPVSTATITPHSQWGKPECPGAAVDMIAVRRAVAALRGVP